MIMILPCLRNMIHVCSAFNVPHTQRTPCNDITFSPYHRTAIASRKNDGMIDLQTCDDRKFSQTKSSHSNQGEMNSPQLLLEFDSQRTRRQALSKLIRSGVGVTLGIATIADFESGIEAARAYEKAYPLELVEPQLGSIQDGRQRRIEQIKERSDKKRRVSILDSQLVYKPVSSLLWGGALWLWSGSRSNPLVTPLANLIFDKDQESWLKDRNEGLFAEIPFIMYFILATVFLCAGFALDTLFLSFFTEGDRNAVLQLAGVSLISGAFWELGRVAAGEKKPTRVESDRSNLLEREFAEFAASRLKLGTGNCHRSEVVQAFRRFYGKYRVENEEYPLGDLEIERLLRAWSKTQPSNIEMSSAGFYNGIQVNRDADVFVKR